MLLCGQKEFAIVGIKGGKLCSLISKVRELRLNVEISQLLLNLLAQPGQSQLPLMVQICHTGSESYEQLFRLGIGMDLGHFEDFKSEFEKRFYPDNRLNRVRHRDRIVCMTSVLAIGILGLMIVGIMMAQDFNNVAPPQNQIIPQVNPSDSDDESDDRFNNDYLR